MSAKDAQCGLSFFIEYDMRDGMMIRNILEYSVDPTRVEIELIEKINKRNNRVETTMRLRALAELSELLDTESLLLVLDQVVKGRYQNADSRL
jgi:hypothetical protein